ncbi:PREDICTED: uncharacterized protein LOC109164747 [Ipomoea nil]|uniref:uncharacterized protein LOC109164747 n=1 Tax=Ipomoea nil TaxID=35883 RepID=UPI000900BAAB|nr:PREDICTED: uncharacterized protein LOC109164747 [Ipomoea nil]
MAKAYDRMEWPFVNDMLVGLGFDAKWIQLIMMCIQAVQYRVLVNGRPTEVIVPSRGLRQGDPLSPYLFNICAERLSLLLQDSQAKGRIHGCRVARGAPPISHLFFVDDSLLFFKANLQETQEVKRCLSVYETFSGQAVNFHKSSVSFSRNTQEEMRDLVSGTLTVAQAEDFGKYLGLPSVIGRNRRAVFAYIEKKLKQRFGSWNKRLLTKAGKEVLLKSVAQAMPTYTMSIYLLSTTLRVSLERLMNRYWWGQGGNDGSIHWLAWDRMCKPKKYGGMGFKRLHEFNLALLAKQGWRLLTSQKSLMARVFKARYFPTTSFYEAVLGGNPSYVWRSIMASQNLLKSGCRRRIGNDRDTQIWGIPWLPDLQNPYVDSVQVDNGHDLLVSDLIDASTGSWKNDYLQQLCSVSNSNSSYCQQEFCAWAEEWLGDDTVFSSEMQGRICGVLHSIWTTRNSAVWDAAMPGPSVLLCRLHAQWSAWKDTELRRVAASGRNSDTGPAHASPATPGTFSCFVDAGFHGPQRAPAFRFVVYGGDLSFVVAANSPLACPYDPLLAEVMALCEALSWLRINGYSGGSIYTDSSLLVSSLISVSSFRNYFGFTLLACKHLVNALPGSVVCYVNREANQVAHSLSKHVAAVAERSVWRDVPPSFIQSMLANTI